MNQPPGRARRRHLTLRGLPVATAAAVLGVWWAATASGAVDSFFLPSPVDIGQAAARIPGHLLQQTWVTLAVTLAGFAVAAVIGILVAIAMAASQYVEAAVLPLLVATNSIPKVALAPLLLAWFGFGPAPRVVLVVTICVFPVVLSSYAGLTGTPAELAALARSLCAPGWVTFVKIRLPWALPQIFVGLRLAVTLAVIGTVVAEFINPDEGLGAVIQQASSVSDTALTYTAIIVLGIISTVLYYATASVEKLLLPWAKETAG